MDNSELSPIIEMLMTDQRPKPSAAHVARILIELAEQDRDVDQEPMTHMRLQKLLYYVQGWSLARRGQKAFDDRLEAWEHGPVVPVVYRQLKGSGKKPIDLDQLEEGEIDSDLKAFIASVWSDYRSHSAIRLRGMTHDEAPWKDAWDKCILPSRGQEEITEAALLEYFQSVAPKGVRKFKRMKPKQEWFDEPSPFLAEGA